MKSAARARESDPVPTTSFFRDPDQFEALKSIVFPAILKDRPPAEPIRIWVPGCGNGEEAYSHAIALLEYQEASRAGFSIQIFGTDLSEGDIHTARWGVYPESSCGDISSTRLQRFFTAVKGGYRLNRRVRDICVFARQDISNDPPFARMDFVACRNMLSEMSSDFQRRVRRRLHYALKPTGFLMLGSRENIAEVPADLFAKADSKYRIYRKKAVPGVGPFWLNEEDQDAKGAPENARGTNRSQSDRPIEVETLAERLLLTKYAPAAVIVDDNLEIIRTQGNTGRYLELPAGRATLKLLDLARPGLMSTLQDAIGAARKKQTPVRKESIEIDQAGFSSRVNLEVIPLGTSSGANRQWNFMIVFEGPDGYPAEKEKPVLEKAAPRSQLSRLRRELKATREYLRTTIDRQVTRNEELQAANEEVLTSNEELQSANEELLSTNEELRTVNEELRAFRDRLESTHEELNTAQQSMKDRDLELMQAHNEMVNVPLVIVGPDFKVRRYTPLAGSALGLAATDIGRPVTELRTMADLPNLKDMLHSVMSDAKSVQQEVQDAKGVWYRLRIVPYPTTDESGDGAVLTLMDITDLKRSLGELAAGRAKLEETFHVMQSGLIVAEAPSGKLQMANDRLWEILGEDLRDEGCVLDYARHGLDGDGFSPDRKAWAIARSMKGETVHGEEIEWRRADGRHVFLAVNSSPICDKAGNIVSVIATFADMTSRRTAEEMLRVSEQMAATGRLAAALAHEINNPLAVLTNLCYLISTQSAIRGQVRNYVNMASKELDRISHISNSLLGLYRAQSKAESFLVREVINDVLEAFASKIVAGKVRAVKRYEAEGVMHGSYTELRQVIVNLVGNALVAMEKGGVLTIRTSASRDWRNPSIRGFCVSVSDTGDGIPTELRARLFEPFFSTKGAKGTGLGLWVSKGIIHRYGGDIRVRSRTDSGKSGTTFSVFLPNSTVKHSLKSARTPGQARNNHPTASRRADPNPSSRRLNIHGAPGLGTGQAGRSFDGKKDFRTS